jgi:hypothetical protein
LLLTAATLEELEKRDSAAVPLVAASARPRVAVE